MMFNKLLNGLKDRLQSSDNRRVEDRLYEVIYREIETNNLNPAAKARAMADGGDNDKLIMQAYIRHRLKMLKDEVAPTLTPPHTAERHRSNELPVRVKPQSFENLSSREQLHDFMARMRHVDDLSVAQLLVAALTEFDRMASTSPESQLWFMEYSPDHDDDLLTFSEALYLRIKVHQSSGEMMLAPPLLIWMHTARGILDENLTADAVKMWEELRRKGLKDPISIGWSMLGDITEELLERTKFFRPEALYQRYEMLERVTARTPQRHASKGDVHDTKIDSVDKITDIILDTLQAQIDLSGRASSRMPDDYVVGYVVGYCDAVLQRKGVDQNSPEGLAVLTITFQSLYGMEIGSQRLRDFLKQQSSMSDCMYDGLQCGGKDVFEWLLPKKGKSGSNGPMGLYRHLTECQ
jgi:hypothetical protein